MRKKFFVMLIILISCILGVNTYAYAKNQLKLFYSGKLLNLSQEIISMGNEYFINAKELTAVIGTNCKIDLTNKELTVKVGDTATSYEIKSYDYTIVDASSISHNYPELISQTVYFPFTFIANLYNVNIRYDKKSELLYFFPRDNKIQTFINDKYFYTLNIPENLYLSLDQAQDNFDVSSISLMNADNTFSASIICDTVNKTTIKNMRFLLSDYVSPDEYIFERVVEYKQSYFRSLIDAYKNDFLFGNSDKALSESNIKIIREYYENLYGQNSNILLFNTVSSNKYTSSEDINLIITIPSYTNETIYTLTFTMQRGALNDKNINNIIQIIKGLTIENLSAQETTLEVLNDRTSIDAANRGIYPDITDSEKKYILLEDTSNLFSLLYPANYIPYLQNSFINNHSYRSFKINHSTSFSVTVEQSVTDSSRIITNKIDSLKSYYSNKITVKNIKEESINGKNFTVLNYELDNNYTKEFVTNYYITNGARLYTIQLKSLVSNPSQNILTEFRRIVASFDFTEQQSNKDINKSIAFVKYFNEQQGYSIFYPTNWSIQDNSQDINYDLIEITNPNFSGPLSITINQSEYTAKLTTTELLRYITGYDSSLSKYFKNYIPPYANKTYKLLNSSVTTNGDTTIIYKLVNYIDEGDRYKMCYSIDLIKDNKINSLYISASEYLFQDGVLADKDLNYILDFMSKSFQIEEKEEENFIAKAVDNEKNKKIKFIEESFRNAFGEASTITFAKNLESEKDVLVYINNTHRAGAYRLSFDYNNKKIQVISRVLSEDIEKSAKEKMKNMLKEKHIHNISVNSYDMTITVKYSETPDTAPVNKTYYMLVTPSKKGYTIDFIRKLDAQVVKEMCKNFLDNRYLTSVQISLPKNYSYSNENRNKYFYEKQVIPVYAEFDGQSGYYYLEVDPVTDSVKLLMQISSAELREKIEEHYYLIDPFSTVQNYRTTKLDKFSFDVSVITKSNNMTNEVIYMYYDQGLIFLSKDPYFSGALIP